MGMITLTLATIQQCPPFLLIQGPAVQFSALPPRHSMEAIAKFDFTASGEDELSFQAGDMLKETSIKSLLG
ncbi:hypothetical protein EK904_008241 [Melospiza melodia maxima]|nr:hypothetical protein EK904_008241 [Melospiza melodia maxima]